MARDTYEYISQPYDDQLNRDEGDLNLDTAGSSAIGSSSLSGNKEVVKDSSQFSDLWIENELRSINWKPKKSGFYINGQTGYAEFSDVFISGDITANTGYIGGTEGWVITPGYIKDISGETGLSSVVTGGNDIRFWAGNADPALAPFRVYENGDMVANSVTLTGYIVTGGGEADVASTLTQLSDLDSNLGSITAGTVTGALIRTSSSGSRVQLNDSTNTLQIYDASNDLRAESFTNGLNFYNSGGTAVGQLYVEDTAGTGELQLSSSNRNILIAAGTTSNDLTLAAGGSLLLNIDGGTGNVHFINGADIVLGSTTIVGGGTWTFTLPSNNGTSGQYLETDGSGNASWSTVTGGANTALSNLTTTSINTSLIPGLSSADLGTSALPWDRLYIDDIYLDGSNGSIYYNNALSIDFFASSTRFVGEITPTATLGADLGTSALRWDWLYIDDIDANGDVGCATVQAGTGSSSIGSVTLASSDISSVIDIDLTGDITFSAGEFITSGSDMEYNASSDHIFYIGGVLKAIIDANIFTEGDLLANGTKPFLIPHPDGSERMLRYTAQESPEVILRHRGKGVTDVNSKAVITLPDHYTLVTEETGDVTVNLTPIGDNRIFLETEPTNSSIEIGSNNPNVSFHYEVMAVRKGYLNAGVELDKTDASISDEDKDLVIKMESISTKNQDSKDSWIAKNEARMLKGATPRPYPDSWNMNNT